MINETGVLFDVDEGGIATLTLNEPARLNPITTAIQQGCLNVQLQLLLQILLHAFQHPFSGSLRSHVEVAVICIAHKFMPALFQLPI